MVVIEATVGDGCANQVIGEEVAGMKRSLSNKPRDAT